MEAARADVRKNFLTIRAVHKWRRLPQKVVSQPSLEVGSPYGKGTLYWGIPVLSTS